MGISTVPTKMSTHTTTADVPFLHRSSESLHHLCRSFAITWPTHPYERFFFQQIIINPFLFLYKLINLYSIYNSINNCAPLLKKWKVWNILQLCPPAPLFIIYFNTSSQFISFLATMTSHKCLHTEYSASVENFNLTKSPLLLLLLYHFLVSLYYLFFTCFLPRTCFAQFFAHVLRSACSSLLSLLYF